MSSSRAYRRDNRCANVLGLGFIDQFNQPCRGGPDRSITGQPRDNVLRTLPAPLGNPFGQQFGTANDRKYGDTAIHRLGRSNNTARHVDNGDRALGDGGEAFGGNSIKQAMRAPRKSETPLVSSSFEGRRIERFVILGIGLSRTRHNAAGENDRVVMLQRVAGESDDRVFPATRRTDHENKGPFMRNAGMIRRDNHV